MARPVIRTPPINLAVIPVDGLFSRNYESDADVIAPQLAQVSVAAAVYFWLHSRTFACHNEIHLSIKFLASMLGVGRKSAANAVKRLEEAGLIMRESRPGVGGGTVFRLANVTGCSPKGEGFGGFKREATVPPNVTDPTHDEETDTNTKTRGTEKTATRKGTTNGNASKHVNGQGQGRFSRFDGAF